MLVLSRKKQEGVTITIPPSDRPTTLHVGVERVKRIGVALSFDAPREVRIVRDELVVRDSADVVPICEPPGAVVPELLDDASLNDFAEAERRAG